MATQRVRKADLAPIRNRIQTRFLDPGVREKMARHLWGANADEVIRAEFLCSYRRNLIDPILNEQSDYGRRESKRKRILKRCRALRASIEEMTSTLNGDDDKLRFAHDKARGQINHGNLPGLSNMWRTSSEDLRTQTNRELENASGQIENERRTLTQLQYELGRVRAKCTAVSPEDIQVSFKLIDNPMEMPNGIPVRIRCSLHAKPHTKLSLKHDVVWQQDLWIDIAPILDDEYSSLIQKLQKRRISVSRDYGTQPRFVVLVGRYEGRGAKIDEVRALFANSRLSLVLYSEIGEELPLVGYPTQDRTLFDMHDAAT